MKWFGTFLLSKIENWCGLRKVLFKLISSTVFNRLLKERKGQLTSHRKQVNYLIKVFSHDMLV